MATWRRRARRAQAARERLSHISTVSYRFFSVRPLSRNSAFTNEMPHAGQRQPMDAPTSLSIRRVFQVDLTWALRREGPSSRVAFELQVCGAADYESRRAEPRAPCTAIPTASNHHPKHCILPADKKSRVALAVLTALVHHTRRKWLSRTFRERRAASRSSRWSLNSPETTGELRSLARAGYLEGPHASTMLPSLSQLTSSASSGFSPHASHIVPRLVPAQRRLDVELRV